MAAATYLKALGVVLLLVVVQHCFKLINQTGVFRIVYNHSPGPCRYVNGIEHGSEDLFLLPNNKMLVSSGLHFFLSPKVENHRGSIYLVDLNDPEFPSVLLSLVGFTGATFNPHGLSAWVDKATGKTYVFIVLHDPEAIGKFELDEEGGRLILLKLYQSPYMINLNSVLPTGVDAFYFTNVLSTTNPILGRLQFLVNLPSGSVVYFDGSEYKYAFKGVFGANGLAASHDLKTLYLGAMEQLLVLSRSQNDDLTVQTAIQLDFAVDNIFVDDAGAVWTAGVPRLFDALLHLDDPSKLAGSRVLKITFGDHGHEITDVYVDDGRQLIGSTKAVYYDGRMLVGTIDHRLLYCDVNAF